MEAVGGDWRKRESHPTLLGVLSKRKTRSHSPGGGKSKVTVAPGHEGGRGGRALGFSSFW